MTTGSGRLLTCGRGTLPDSVINCMFPASPRITAPLTAPHLPTLDGGVGSRPRVSGDASASGDEAVANHQPKDAGGSLSTGR